MQIPLYLKTASGYGILPPVLICMGQLNVENQLIVGDMVSKIILYHSFPNLLQERLT